MSHGCNAPALDPARVTAGEWAALFYRQRVLDDLSQAARALEQREIDRLAEELVKRAHEAGLIQSPLPIEPLQPFYPVWPAPSCDHDRCSVCGNRYADMTHFVCSHPQCPSRVTFTATPNP